MGMQVQHLACFADIMVLMTALLLTGAGETLHTCAADMLQATMTQNNQIERLQAGTTAMFKHVYLG